MFPFMFCDLFNSGDVSALERSLSIVCDNRIEFSHFNRINYDSSASVVRDGPAFPGGVGVSYILGYVRAIQDSMPDSVFRVVGYARRSFFDDESDFVDFDMEVSGNMLWGTYLKRVLGGIQFIDYCDDEICEIFGTSVEKIRNAVSTFQLNYDSDEATLHAKMDVKALHKVRAIRNYRNWIRRCDEKIFKITSILNIVHVEAI